MQQRKPDLLDHLVGERKQRRRDFESECLGCSEIEHKLEFTGTHDRQVTRIFALENASGVDAGLAIGVGDVRSVAHQPAVGDIFAHHWSTCRDADGRKTASVE